MITIIKQGERVLYISIDLSLARLLAKLGLLDDIINLAHNPPTSEVIRCD